MKLVVDTHVHFYPCYDTARALELLQLALSRFDRNAFHLAFLAERYDCSFFADMVAGVNGEDEQVHTIQDQGNVLRIESQDKTLYLFAGRQIVTREGVEILALTTDTRIPDGLSVFEVIDRVLAEGALPVIAWAPGKWMFSRKQVVTDLFRHYTPDDLLIGDTSLRPTSWPEPMLMRDAAKRGFTIVAGSDPLPFAGEEAMMGRFVTTVTGDFAPHRPVDSVRALFRSPNSRFSRIGCRCSPIQTFVRLYKNSRSKK